MRYETPKIKTIGMNELLAQLGPARALLYTPGGDDGGGRVDDPKQTVTS